MQKADLYIIGAILLILGTIEIFALVLAGATSEAVAAWVQALGSLLGLGIAIAIPWRIHLREQKAAQEPRRRSIVRLQGALRTLQEEIEVFSRVRGKYLAEEGAEPITAVNMETLKVVLLSTFSTVQDFVPMLADAIKAADLADVELIQLLNAIQNDLAENANNIAGEIRWLQRKTTVPILHSSMSVGGYLSDVLSEKLNIAIAALAPEI